MKTVQVRGAAVLTDRQDGSGVGILEVIPTWRLTHAQCLRSAASVLAVAHLPLSQTPSLKRIYTKAHSLYLHLLDLHPESRLWWWWGGGDGMATRRGEQGQKRTHFRQRYGHINVMNL